MKHKYPYGNTHTASKAAFRVLQEQSTLMQLDYQKQLEDKAADDWYRNLAMSILTFREITGDNKRTEKFAQRLADKLAESRGMATDEIVKECAMVTGIELEVED